MYIKGLCGLISVAILGVAMTSKAQRQSVCYSC